MPTAGPHPPVPENENESISRFDSMNELENTGIGFLVRHLHRGFTRELAERLAPYGVMPAQWTVLRALWLEDGCSQVELAIRVRVEKASLTNVLFSLEKQGLILRKRSEMDRRRWNVYLTKQGREIKSKLIPFAGEINSIATGGFSKQEIQSFRAMLLKALNNLQ